jgi:hypothetical protein
MIKVENLPCYAIISAELIADIIFEFKSLFSRPSNGTEKYGTLYHTDCVRVV